MEAVTRGEPRASAGEGGGKVEVGVEVEVAAEVELRCGGVK